LERAHYPAGFFFAEAYRGIDSVFKVCRRKFTRVFPPDSGRKQATLGQSISNILGKTEDEIERQKRIVSGGNPLKLKGYTIFEYYWELNEMLKPKKSQ
jgi:hypothetical protein